MARDGVARQCRHLITSYSPFFLFFFLFTSFISLDIAMGVRRGEGPAVDLLWDQLCWNSVVTMERVIVKCCGSQEPSTE